MKDEITGGLWALYCTVCDVLVVKQLDFEGIEEAWKTHIAGAIHKAGGYLPPEPEDDLSLDPDDSIRNDWLRGPPPPNYVEPSDHPVFIL